MADQEYKILMSVVGADRVQDLSQKLKKAKEDLLALIEAERQAGNATDLTNAKIQAQVQAIQGLSSGLNQAQSSLKGVSVDVNRLGTNLSYLADDAQQFKNGAVAGFQAIGNNIAPILAAIPGIGQFAGYIALAGTAAAVLYEHWDQLMGAFGSGKVKTEAEEMKELADNTQRTADQEERYQKLKERAKHAEAQGKEPEKVSEYKANIDKAISNGPQSEVEKDLDRIFGQHLRTMAQISPGYDDAVTARDKAKKDLEYSVEHRGEGEDTDRARKSLGDAQRQVDSFYGEARKRFAADLGKDDQKGNVKRLADETGNKTLAEALRKADPDVEKQKKKEAKDAEEERKADEAYWKREEEHANKLYEFNKKADEEEARRRKKEDDELAREDEFYAKQARDEEETKLKAEYDAWRKEQDKRDILESRRTKDYMGVAPEDRTDTQKKAHDLDQKDFDEAKKKLLEGNSDKQDAISEQMKALQEFKSQKSETLEGGASFAEKIQSGVSNDTTQKAQLKTLEGIKSILEKQAKGIQRQGFAP